MAGRPKVERKIVDLTTVPADMELVPQEITISEEKENDKVTREKSSQIVDVLVPKNSAEGIFALQNFLLENGFKDANEPVTNTLRRHLVKDVTYALNKQGVALSKNQALIPVFSDISVANPAEAAGTKLTAWLMANPGQVPDAAAMAEIYAGVIR